jgi:RES domain-containing protein
MALGRFVVPRSGDLLRHRPKASARSVLDDTYLGQAGDNRWSTRGVRAYYFAVDRGIVAAEYARHVAADLPVGHAERIERAVYSVAVALERTLDLTSPKVVAAMGARPINDWILDLATTQAAGAYLLSQVAGLQGLVVPSVAFLDDHARCNVVVFRDAIDPAVAFGAPVHVMDIVLEAAGKGGA